MIKFLCRLIPWHQIQSSHSETSTSYTSPSINMKFIKVIAEKLKRKIPGCKSKASHPINIEINRRKTIKIKSHNVSKATEDCWVESFITPEKVHALGSPPQSPDPRTASECQQTESLEKVKEQFVLSRRNSWHSSERVENEDYQQRPKSLDVSRSANGTQSKGIITTIPFVKAHKASVVVTPLISFGESEKAAGDTAQTQALLKVNGSYRARIEASRNPGEEGPVSPLKPITITPSYNELHSTIFKQSSSLKRSQRRQVRPTMGRTKSQERMLISMNIAKTLAANTSSVTVVDLGDEDVDEQLRSRLGQMEQEIRSRASVVLSQ
ncbi:MAG: hypothetical protein M1831_007140 [Alyxoria varia]|nr:MAG: hypothetical protein M1831_007140 [Alyxoria varia]